MGYTELERRLCNIESDLSSMSDSYTESEIATAAKIETLSIKVDELTDMIKGLVAVWEQARGMITLVKWLSAIAGSLASVYIFFKGR